MTLDLRTLVDVDTGILQVWYESKEGIKYKVNDPASIRILVTKDNQDKVDALIYELETAMCEVHNLNDDR